MDQTNKFNANKFNANKFKQVVILDDKFIFGKSIYKNNEKKVKNDKYILNFIKEYNRSLNYINKFEINFDDV